MYFILIKFGFNKILFSLMLLLKINHKFLPTLTTDIGRGTPDQGIVAAVRYRLGGGFLRW